ncbi:hypothetical protein S40285_09614 [Stachybotrys chlorohalonatus IBT 40285]|uniref:Uncharacterized protein n=1 Tax=Stachybotrys chlorohalonatus (strain IBT 40285) TaxID=1283841 RepID=A0A084Q856_STAC4|nr:hypothetical protein S40285_09614 [Stachybotrys chlorohalonata IBT 40285]
MGFLNFLLRRSKDDRSSIRGRNPNRSPADASPNANKAQPVARTEPASLAGLQRPSRLFTLANESLASLEPPPSFATRLRSGSGSRPRTAPHYASDPVAVRPQTPGSMCTEQRSGPPYLVQGFVKPSAGFHERSHSSASKRSTAFVDILDAHGSLRPLDFRARIQATGARDYGEDVADRNLAVNGVDLSSPIVQEFYALHGKQDMQSRSNDWQHPQRAAGGRLSRHSQAAEPFRSWLPPTLIDRADRTSIRSSSINSARRKSHIPQAHQETAFAKKKGPPVQGLDKSSDDYSADESDTHVVHKKRHRRKIRLPRKLSLNDIGTTSVATMAVRSRPRPVSMGCRYSDSYDSSSVSNVQRPRESLKMASKLGVQASQNQTRPADLFESADPPDDIRKARRNTLSTAFASAETLRASSLARSESRQAVATPTRAHRAGASEEKRYDGANDTSEDETSGRLHARNYHTERYRTSGLQRSGSAAGNLESVQSHSRTRAKSLGLANIKTRFPLDDITEVPVRSSSLGLLYDTESPTTTSSQGDLSAPCPRPDSNHTAATSVELSSSPFPGHFRDFSGSATGQSAQPALTAFGEVGSGYTGAKSHHIAGSLDVDQVSILTDDSFADSFTENQKGKTRDGEALLFKDGVFGNELPGIFGSPYDDGPNALTRAAMRMGQRSRSNSIEPIPRSRGSRAPSDDYDAGAEPVVHRLKNASESIPNQQEEREASRGSPRLSALGSRNTSKLRADQDKTYPVVPSRETSSRGRKEGRSQGGLQPRQKRRVKVEGTIVLTK